MSCCGAEIGAIITSVTNIGLKVGPDSKKKKDLADKLHENREKLQAAVRSLDAKNARIDIEIKQQQQGTDQRNPEYEDWLLKVENAKMKANYFDTKYQKMRKAHYLTRGSGSRAKLSEEMDKLALEIDALRKEMNPDEALITGESLHSVQNQSSKENDKLPWVKERVKNILGILQEEGLKHIGIYGLPGVGKTTIMRSLNDNAIDFFDFVIFVTVGKADNNEEQIQWIQQSIAEQLKLNLQNIRNLNQVARQISAVLRDKKYLLLLDHVLREIDLERLGIEKNYHKKGKVVVATRSKLVCRNMHTDDEIEVETLSKEEAMNLFRQTAGPIVDHPRISNIAERIVPQCGGWPSLIISLATNLRHYDAEDDWNACLTTLQDCSHQYSKDFDDAYNAFKFIYNGLKDYQKRCFLYGALFPQDQEIHKDHLIECWRAKQFIPSAGGSNHLQIFRTAREDGHHTVMRLIDSCLLARCRKMKYVTMSPLFRGWALQTHQGDLSLVKFNNDTRNNSAARNRGIAERISIKCENLRTSLQGVNFKIISTLLLQRNERLENILDSVFVPESSLRVLDLGYSGIHLLPPTISNLTKLKALYLNDCRQLGELPAEIVRLKELEILDICRTGIRIWPNEIGGLVGLRCLRVPFVGIVHNRKQIEVQPMNMIASLTLLEELTIVVDETHQNQWNGVVENIITEIANLEVLTTLCFYFPNVVCLSAFITNSHSWNDTTTRWGTNTFRSFKILVGSSRNHHVVDMSGHRAERQLTFFARNEPPNAISEVLRQAGTFQLIGHETIQHLSSFGTDSTAGLEICAIEDCNEMTSIIRPDNTGAAALTELKHLLLINLRKLTCICEGQVARGSLSSLTTLTIYNCQNLTVIMPCELIRQLSLLEYLRVERCRSTTMIVEACEGDRENGEIRVVTDPMALLPSLKRLELVSLAALRSISQNSSLEWPSLSVIEIDQCPGLEGLPLSISNAKKLKLIKCDEDCWNRLNLDPEVRRRFQSSS